MCIIRLENIAKKNPYDFKSPEITAVYKMNVATEKMVPIGQVTSQVEEDEFTIELFPDLITSLILFLYSIIA